MPTDVALQMAPLTDSWIIYENIAHGNGSTVLPSGKYGKFGSRGSFCRRSLAIFSLYTEEGGNARKKRNEWKNREWVHFPRVDERELASTYSLLFTTPRRFATISYYQKPRCIAISLYSSLTQLDFWICASNA